MNVREMRLKLIRDTVIHSILIETENNLEHKKALDKKLLDALLDLTRSKVTSILDSMNEAEIFPENDLTNKQELEHHILRIIDKVKLKLGIQLEEEA